MKPPPLDVQRIILAAMKSPIGSLVLMAVLLYLLTILLGLCGCQTPRFQGFHADGPDTSQKFDAQEGVNFGPVP